MAERPILFSGPMVRAILDGRKTVTRRVVTQTVALEWLAPGMFTPAFVADPDNGLAPYQPGDTLWVRETWGVARYPGPSYAINYRSVPPVLLTPVPDERVDWAAPKADERWRPSIHMPRWAARLFLRVTEVRVERLQEITEEDAVAEGFYHGPEDHRYMALPRFRDLWERLNAKRGFGWGSNPWVWVYRFERTEAPHG